MADYHTIKNSEHLTAIFRRWPSFHDAEVIWLRFDRRPTSLGDGPTVETLIHAFEMTKEVDASGYYVLKNHVLVHLRFSRVREATMDGFNHQNVLLGLNITDVKDRQMEQINYEVRFDPAFGLQAGFLCKDIEVVSVTPWDSDVTGERGGPKPVA